MISYIKQVCRDLFGEIFTPKYIESMINQTNAYYGATNLDVTNVAFVHGSIDPWNAMGHLTWFNDRSPVLIIEGSIFEIIHVHLVPA